MDLVLLSPKNYYLNGNMYDFSVDYNLIGKSDILKIQKSI